MIVGISGGIDPAVRTLCVQKQDYSCLCSSPCLPFQIEEQHDLSMILGQWLTDNFINVEHILVNLDKVYDRFYLDMLNIDMDNELH